MSEKVKKKRKACKKCKHPYCPYSFGKNAQIVKRLLKREESDE